MEQTWQIIGVMATILLAVVGGFWAIVARYFRLSEARTDKRFDLIDQKLESMNQRIFELAMALRPHIQEVQEQKLLFK